MAEHQLKEGKEWIEALVALGEALGYLPEAEFDVSAEDEEDADVDVAWLRSESDKFPLFIFEVETKPSGQLLANAGKVFSQETELFEKPLFHFHFILRGKGESNKVKYAKREYGTYNYRLYSVANENVATEALCDIISQHRRVSEGLDVAALAAWMRSGIWSDVDAEAIWKHAEECDFGGNWLREYTELALVEEDFMPRLVRLMRHELDGERFDLGQYRSRMALECGSAIHAGIIAALEPREGERCFDAVREWQGVPPQRTVEPRYLSNGDYDNFVFALMPGAWALIAALLSEVRGARLWILEQMRLVIAKDDLPHPGSALTAIWMLHIAAGGGAETKPHFGAAREHLNAQGGVAPHMLRQPRVVGAYVKDWDPWWDELMTGRDPIPALEEFQETFTGDGVAVIPVALHFLLDELPPEQGTKIASKLANR